MAHAPTGRQGKARVKCGTGAAPRVLIRFPEIFHIFVAHTGGGKLTEMCTICIVRPLEHAMPSSPGFKFYEQVRIAPSKPQSQSVAGELGVIFGMSGEPGAWTYGVFVLRIEEVWCFDEAELQTTGVFFHREDFYSGKSGRVRVDSSGRGKIVSREPNDKPA
jgi:hypothetical protein